MIERRVGLIKLGVLILLANLSNSLYLKINKDTEKCLYEEVFNDSTMIVLYDILNNFAFINTQPNDVKIQFYIKNEDSNDTLFTFDELQNKGKISFHLKDSRNILICFKTNYNPWFTNGDELDIKIQIHTSFDEIDETAAKNKEFEGLNAEISKTKNEISKIVAMQKAEKSQEERFTDSQQSTSNSILYISVIQILLVLVLGFLQIKLVKRLFNSM